MTFTCGGTGGHILPAIAIADRLKHLAPGIEINFVGSRDRLEWSLVPRHGYAIRSVPCAPFHRPLASLRNVRTLLLQVAGIISAIWLLIRKRPSAVVGTGGYIAVPTCVAAWLLKIPVFLHESNAFPGLATRFLVNTLGAATRLYLGFEKAETYLKHASSMSKPAIVTGNPVREGIIAENRKWKSKDEAMGKLFGLRNLSDGTGGGGESVCLCVMGGSLGAERINQVVQESYETILETFPNVCMIWQTGERHYAAIEERERDALRDFRGRLAIVPFLNDMELVYSACDVCLCRSGALTCSELVASRCPSILIPSPNVTEDHQKRNAQELEEIGGAILMEEETLNKESLLDSVALAVKREKLNDMRDALQAASISTANASEIISKDIISQINQKKKR